MEVQMFSTSIACARGPKESLMHAFSCACSYKCVMEIRLYGHVRHGKFFLQLAT